MNSCGQLIDLMHGEHENFRGRHGPPDLACGLEAVHLRHRDVEDDDIGVEFRRFGHRFASGRRFAADNPLGIRLEEDAHTLSHDFVIIRDEDLSHGAKSMNFGTNRRDFQWVSRLLCASARSLRSALSMPSRPGPIS